MRYDLVVVGGGPAGYTACERAARLGRRVLLVERGDLGGVCANEGCIPLKCLIGSARRFRELSENPRHGVLSDNPRFDIERAMEWKSGTVAALRGGVESLLRNRGVEIVFGEAVFPGGRRVIAGDREFEGDHLLVATGSSPLIPPIPGIDQPNIVTSRELLSVSRIPKSLVVVGGGAIGVEFSSLFSSIGSEVHLFEIAQEILPFMDRAMAARLRRSLDGVNFHLGTRIDRFDGNRILFTGPDGVSGELETEMVLVSAGRKPNVEGLGLTGMDVTGAGVRTDDRMATNIPGIWAAGDVTGRSLLAHSASRMGEVAVSNMFAAGGNWMRMRLAAIPWVVYSIPEAAGCGLTEDACRKARGGKRGIVMGTSRMGANGRFLAEHGKADGICKVIADSETGVILGVHMFGADCGEMIFGAAAAIEAELRVKDLAEVVFPHPTVSEVIREALLNPQSLSGEGA